MEDKLKILVFGDVNGKFNVFFKKIESLMKKTAFDLILCVGDFFNGSDDVLKAYKAGSKKIPAPIYIQEGTNKINNEIYAKKFNENGEYCENLVVLGKSGSYTTSSGLKIVYLSGIDKLAAKDCAEFNTFGKEDVMRLLTSIKGDRGVDILLTSQWPFGIFEPEENSSKLVSFLALQLKPRYHFCGLNKKSFENAPFRFPADERSALELGCRFVGLADVGNPEKHKYVYALNITPVNNMRLTDLIQKTTDEVENPYLKIDFSPVYDLGDSKQYFYNMEPESHGKRHRRDDRDNRKKFKQSMDLEKCWFCLGASDNLEKDLIISIGNNFYLAALKGPLNNTHVMILSVNHIQSASLLNDEDFQELDLYKRALRQYFQSLGLVTIFYERNYKTSHLMINAIGIDKAKEALISEVFEEKAAEFGLKFEEISKLKDVKELPEGVPYFVAELPGDKTLITRNMSKFPINFGREVLCSEDLLNCEDKIEWKSCLLPKNLELKMVGEFKEGFKDYDFTIDDD